MLIIITWKFILFVDAAASIVQADRTGEGGASEGVLIGVSLSRSVKSASFVTRLL